MSKRAEELAKQLYPDPKLENYDDILVYRTDRDNALMGRANVICVYEQAEKDLGWHSVNESLPEETEYVTDNGCHQKWSKSVFAITTGNSVMVCWTKDGEFFCDKDFHFPVKVKYWMPMPKIP